MVTMRRGYKVGSIKFKGDQVTVDGLASSAVWGLGDQEFEWQDQARIEGNDRQASVTARTANIL
jgi:hypothetical protein